MDSSSSGDFDHLPGDSGDHIGVGPDALAIAISNGHRHVPRFMYVFVGAIVGALLTVSGLAIWWRHYQHEQDAKDARQAAAAVLRECQARAESGAQIKATSEAAVDHAEDTAALMKSISDILTSAGSTSPRVAQIAAEIDRYVGNVAQFRAIAEQYHPVTVDECVQSKAPAPGD